MSEAKILITEDESITAEDMRRSLHDMGYSVVGVVDSGEEAIEKAEEYEPDLVLMDISLAGEMDGIEAAEQIHSRFNIPVVYLTAYANENTIERAKITEPYGYVIKPFEDRELHSNIQMALYKHRMEEEQRRLHNELEKKNRELEQRVTELTALNKLFQKHLSERFAVTEAYRDVLQGLEKLCQEASTLAEWARAQPLPEFQNARDLRADEEEAHAQVSSPYNNG
ncbi:MAG: response regulator [Dehalococcoidia bacterium]